MAVRSGSALLHVATFGNGRTPVLLLHGLGGTIASWGGIPADLSRSRRVIVPDLRGCGRSERGVEPYGFELLANDVIAVLDALHAERAHLIGHSLGGVVAQHVLTTRSARCASAVLISTSSRVGERARDAWRRVAATVAQRGLKDQQRAVEQGFSPQFAEARPELLRELTAIANTASPSTYAEQAAIAAEYDYTDALSALECPVLVLQGLGDQLTSPGGSVILSRACRRSRLEMVPAAGHNVHLEMRDAFIGIVDRFLDEAERGG